MHREIKFRMWDKVSKVWLKGILAVDNDGILYPVATQETIASDVEIMQYTGLKDKNGKEIYEGDILDLRGVGGYKTCQVVYEAPAFIMAEPDGEMVNLGMYEDGLLQNYFKIIGNIWETPELLK